MRACLRLEMKYANTSEIPIRSQSQMNMEDKTLRKTQNPLLDMAGSLAMIVRVAFSG